MMQESLAERLRVLRAQRGLSLLAASKQLGIDRHTLRRVELGVQDPQYPTLAKIAEGYDVPVEALLEEPVLAGKAEAPDTGRSEESQVRDLEGQRIGLNYSACRAALEKVCDRWEPVLQEATRRGRLKPETFEDFEAEVATRTPFIDAVAAAERFELGQAYDEEGAAVFWSERSELWPALGRFYGIGLGFSRLANKPSAVEAAAERWGLAG